MTGVIHYSLGLLLLLSLEATVQADRFRFAECLGHLSSNGAWEWHNETKDRGSRQQWIVENNNKIAATCPQKRFRSASAVRRCLRGKWIFIVGDSSVRVLFHHLIKVLGTPPSISPTWEGFPSPQWMPSTLKEGKFCGASDNILANTPVLNCSQDYLHAATGTRLTFAMNTVSNQRTVAWRRYVLREQPTGPEVSIEPSAQVGVQEFVDRSPWPGLELLRPDEETSDRGNRNRKPDILLFDTGLWNSRYGIRTLDPNAQRPKDQPDMMRRTLDEHVVEYTQELERGFQGLKIWAGAPVCCNQFKHYAKRVSIDWARRFNAAAQNNAHLNDHFVYWDRQSTSDVLLLRDKAVGGEHGEAEPPPMVEALRHDCTPGIYHPGGEVLQVQVDALLGSLCSGEDPTLWWSVGQ